MSKITEFIEAAKRRSLSVVLPEGKDERVVVAARRMKDEGIAQPVLLGDVEGIRAAAAAAGVGLDGIRLIDPAEGDQLDAYTQAYVAGRNLNPKVALRMVKRPLYYGGMMVAQGDAHTMVAGVATQTALVIQAGVLTVGLAEGIDTPSSFFLMILPEFQGVKNKCFIYADCAVNIAPTPAELADIAIASEKSARKLLDEEPRVALLSFSTKGSASHINVDHVNETLVLVKQKASHLHIDGELQVDAAIIPSVGAKKVKEPSAVVGRANVLVFPGPECGEHRLQADAVHGRRPGDRALSAGVCQADQRPVARGDG